MVIAVVATTAVVVAVVATVAAGQDTAGSPPGADDSAGLGATPVSTVPVSALGGGTLVPADSDLVAPDGTDLVGISATGDFDLPVVARRAYVRAAAAENEVRPRCHLPWQVLAGIGRVESDHGRADGAVLDRDGVARPHIIGVALDGVGGVAAVPDTDRGRLDGDKVWDRAVGPMQFLPSTWAAIGTDGDGDGRANIDDLNDAARSAAALLCPTSGSLSATTALRAAIYSYNHSDYYVDLVLAFAHGYQTGRFDLPPPPTASPTGSPSPGESAAGPASSATAPTRPATPSSTQPPTSRPTRPTRAPSSRPTRGPTPTRSARPTRGPTPTRSPSPTSSPTSSPYTTGSGVWNACGDTWCLNETALDLGPVSQYAMPAANDYADGTAGDSDPSDTNLDEFQALQGRRVEVSVSPGTTTVYLIEGLGYRNADGSFATPPG